MRIGYYGPVMKYAISAVALMGLFVPASALALCNGVNNSCAYSYDYAAAYTMPYTHSASYSPYQSHQYPQQGYGYQQPYSYYGNNYGGYSQPYSYYGYGPQQPIYFPVYNTYIPNLTPNYGGGYGQQYGGYGNYNTGYCGYGSNYCY